ncbi:PAP2 superfamily protein [Tritrichomonas foetus]|uniref:PAP2 superfamily protein n=1 Tax=Tritrichomonas foetus TaxID=1144522 RepID=A0A1J4KVA8_9EUKA|nr:PAP2 superfamily protein [Tritrichomonas foetus]|eukprot:OHT13676.1 PAP2 superfamily protein [Tritrichomonas foetus]
MGGESGIESQEPRNKKKFNWLALIDPFNIIPAVISIALWTGSTFIKVSPLFVPPGDSQSMFPKAHKNTVENSWVLIYNIVMPFIIVIIFYFLSFKFPTHINKISPLTVMWCAITCVCMTGFFTNVMKKYVGRPRPDMYAWCGSENATYETCTSIKQSKREGEFLSWPSGHSSNAMSGGMFIALLIQKVVKTRQLWVTLIASLPILGAVFVACSRIRDHRHHPDDVLAGMLLGGVITVLFWWRAEKIMFPKEWPGNQPFRV